MRNLLTIEQANSIKLRWNGSSSCVSHDKFPAKQKKRSCIFRNVSICNVCHADHIYHFLKGRKLRQSGWAETRHLLSCECTPCEPHFVLVCSVSERPDTAHQLSAAQVSLDRQTCLCVSCIANFDDCRVIETFYDTPSQELGRSAFTARATAEGLDSGRV